jgi:hypothetical protein
LKQYNNIDVTGKENKKNNDSVQIKTKYIP